jgi:hypothetical protein
MDDGPRLDVEAGRLEWPNRRLEAPPSGGTPNRWHQLGQLVGHEPGVDAAIGLGARTTIEHHARAARLDQQPGRWESRRLGGADAEQRERRAASRGHAAALLSP